MNNLLNKDKSFLFDDSCLHAFNQLKESLVTAPVIITLGWKLDFKLMCDASDYAAGAVLEQRKSKYFHVIHYASNESKYFHVIHYASNVLNEAQISYTTTEKELPAIIFHWKNLDHI